MLLSNLDLLATAPGGVARLRELILTLAVQGKLVPQDPADEPAGELLKKIRTEKDRLIAEGKIKRDKPLAAIAEEEKPFALPQGWEWVKGRELFTVVRGVTYQKTDAKDVPTAEHLPILRANNIRGSINFEDLVYVPTSLISEDQLLRPGDYVVCLASGSKNLVGKAAPFLDGIICSFGAFCGAIRPIAKSAYFAVYLASPMYREAVSEASAGIGINNLKGSSLLDLDIALPPLPEQSRIVTRVEELMRLCDALEAKGRLEAAQHAQLVSTLLGELTASATPEEQAANWQRVAQHFDLLLDRPAAIDALEQTLLQLAVRGLLVPQDPQDEPASTLLARIRTEKDRLIADGQIKRDKPLPPVTDEEKPFELPVGWEWVRMGWLGESFDYGSSQKSVDDSAAVPILRMGNIQGGRVVMNNLKYLKDVQGELPYLVLREGDLLFNRTNSYELVGKTGLFEGYLREVTFASYLIRIRLMHALVIPEYINAYMNTSDCRENEIEPDLTQQTGQANYNGTKLKSIRVPLPPLAEQSRIVTRVTALRRLCADLRQRLADAQTIQSHLAQALVDSTSSV